MKMTSPSALSHGSFASTCDIRRQLAVSRISARGKTSPRAIMGKEWSIHSSHHSPALSHTSALVSPQELGESSRYATLFGRLFGWVRKNYDLSVSEAPKLFSDAEFEAVKRIRHGLEVLMLRKRLKERILSRKREFEVRAAVRLQALARGKAARGRLPAVRLQHQIRAAIKKEQKLFKRELRSEGFSVYLYRTKDGARRKVTLKPNAKLNSICWTTGVAKVTAGSVALVALKVLAQRSRVGAFGCVLIAKIQACYAGYPKQDFPTSSMQARATPLPDKDRTFTLQVDTGKIYVFVTTEQDRGAIQRKLVKGLQSIIDEVSSPESFYFDATGVLRRVTSSIFDGRGNIAQREALKKQRQERYRRRRQGSEEK